MKEIADILIAYQKALKEKKKSALATVVKVEGSSYRRPGARMLITDDGMLTGAISGGCLEGDALRKALSAIHQQETKLVSYDTTDEDDAKFGIQLGCNGVVHILFEPIFPEQKINPITILKAVQQRRENAVLVTFFSLENQPQLGTRILYRPKQLISSLPANEQILADTALLLEEKTSDFKEYEINGYLTSAFLEFICPPISLIIAGAGNDAQPLSEIADQLGWEVTVVDGRPTHATNLRFPKAARVLVSKPDQFLNHISTDERTAFVLMTHNYNYDVDLLGRLIATDAAYIGTLGPKRKLIRMLDELNLNTVENQTRVHGPIGLDIGAETAEEIAISIIAEIKSIFSGASAQFLKQKNAPIHVHDIKGN